MNTTKKEDAAGGKKKKKGNTLMKELLRLRKEAEERAEREAIEKAEREAEAERLKEEQARLELERKEAAKLRKAQSIAAQKESGTFLTKKQKQDRQKAQRLFANTDIILPDAATSTSTGDKEKDGKKKPILYGSKKKSKPVAVKVDEAPIPIAPSPPIDEVKKDSPEPEPEEEVMESWEKIDTTEAPLIEHSKPFEEPKVVKSVEAKVDRASPTDEVQESDSSSDEDSDVSDEEEVEMTVETKELIRKRLQIRREKAESLRTTDNLRSPIICVLGHVDTGKTKLLDNVRRTSVQEGEAGGITQQIGATRVPSAAIKERCRNVRDFNGDDMRIEGMLIIDTPGHESFANLRSRGSSLCDFAILVVDIMHGLEPQTIESLKLLLKRKTPFVVALNKVDRLYEYSSNPRKDIWQHLKAQPKNTQTEFEQRWNGIVGEFSEQGLNVAFAKDKKDPEEYISVIPTSAMNGDGIGNILAHIVNESQTRLAKRLSFCDELECIVMEVRSLPGLGMTIDVILINGHLRINDIIVLSGTEGPISTQIRDLLMPQPLKESRVKNEYEHYKELKGAQGVKILAKNLEHAVAGLPIFVANQEDEIDLFCEDARTQLTDALMSIKKKKEGVYVQASTLGSLEALLEFLKTQKIPYSGVNIGPVHKKDVQKASTMLEHNSEFACILAFDVDVSKDVQQFADKEGVRIFTANIIYHLEDAFLKYRDELKLKRRRENEIFAIFPCKLRVLPQHIFNARNPIVIGVSIEAGKLKKGTPISAVANDEIVFLGTVTSIEHNHELVEIAKSGEEVSIKIENTTGEAPKLYGRHFTHTDPLISRINRQSIDVCKNYFREDLSRQDWTLIVELKKILKIM